MPETAFETCVLHGMTTAVLPSCLLCPGYRSVDAEYRRCWLRTVTALSATKLQAACLLTIHRPLISVAVGEVSKLKELLAAEDVDVDEKDEEGRTALQVQGPALLELMPLHNIQCLR